MRRGVWLLIIGVLLAAAGAASAHGAGSGTTTVETTTSEATAPTPTTTTSTTTTSTTTTATTTTATTTTSATTTSSTTTGTTKTTPAPKSYSSLPATYLSNGCVGAGAAAIAEPGSRVLALGTPAASRGASEYPTRAPIVRFLSATASGSSCSTARVSLGSVSLFGGVITAQSITAVGGRGTVSGLAVYGSPTELSAGDSVEVGGWAQVTLGKTVGRLRAPLVVELTAAHGALPAGTTIAFGFAASPQTAHHTAGAHSNHAANAKASRHANGKTTKAKLIAFPAAPDPFLENDVLTPVAKHNAVVSSAIQYLGIKYQWGGATPATGFDCSGLVTYVFAKLGVSLPHYTVSQYTSPDGVWVSPHHLEAGDLVFFVGSDGTRKAPGHVGIYVADGYFIDAPHTGSFVRVDSLKDKRFADMYVGARRIETQLLVSRHLLGETKPPVTDTAPFLHALSFQASGALPLPIAAAVPTAEHIPAAGGADMLLLVGGPLGALIALSAAGAGAFFVRKRRREDLPEAPLH